MSTRRRSGQPVPPTFTGAERQVRAVAAAVITAWDSWLAGPDYQPALANPVRERIDALRDAVADPDPRRFAAAMTDLLGGVPVPASAASARVATEQLRRAAFPPRAAPSPR